MRALLIAIGFAAVLEAPGPDSGLESATSVYVRADTDRTTVVSPRTRVRVPVLGDRNHIDVVYAVDVWTSASVDVRTAATSAVTEQRNEVVVGGDRKLRWGTAGLGYRFSHEVDYVSNSATAFAQVDARHKTVVIDARVSGGGDIVGRSGDERFRERIGYGSLALSTTYVVGTHTVLQVGEDFRVQRGYLSSPYRWVSLSGTPDCASGLGLCIAEVHPRLRVRSGTMARVRHALNRRWSVGAGYRFYADSWSVLGHTGKLDVRVRPNEALTLGLEQRAYWQRGARFYRSAYGESGSFFTRDRELSSLWNLKTSARAEGRVPLPGVAALRLGGLLGGGLYHYPRFVGLGRVGALEATVVVGLDL